MHLVSISDLLISRSREKEGERKWSQLKAADLFVTRVFLLAIVLVGMSYWGRGFCFVLRIVYYSTHTKHKKIISHFCDHLKYGNFSVGTFLELGLACAVDFLLISTKSNSLISRAVAN